MAKVQRNLTLHEAMILALLQRKLVEGHATLTNHELESVIKSQESFRQKNLDPPDAAQLFLRARQCPEWFTLVGDTRHCEITLKPMKCGGA